MATNPKLEEIANMLMRNKTTSMIAPNEYTDRTRSGQANIDRRAKMIELLQGQADAPIERFGYGGIEAVTPPAAYLNKILSGVMAQYQSGKAGQEQEALDKYKEQAQNEDMGTMIEMLKKGGTVPTDVSSVYDTSYIKDPARRAQQDASLAEPIMPQQPTYTGGMPEGTVSTGKPITPVTEIQERRYSMRTPEGQMELLRQTAAEKQSRAEMLAGQLEREEAARIRAEKEAGLDRRNLETIQGRKDVYDQRAADALKPKPLSTKEFNTVKTKLFTIGELKKQINTVKDAFEKIKNSYSVGATYLSGTFDKDAQNYDAALNTMRELKTQLTRTPGMGSQDAKELAIANAALPERTAFKNPDAMAQQINALDSLITGFERGYQEMADTQNEYYGIVAKPEDPAGTNTAGTKTTEDASTNATIPILKDNPSIDDIVKFYKSIK